MNLPEGDSPALHAASERGLPIMVTTQCKVGTHLFVVADSGATTKPPLPKPEQRCDCGLVAFQDVSEAVDA